MHNSDPDNSCLIADIGGTNARFAMLNKHNEPSQISVHRCSEYTHFADAIHDYLSVNKLATPAHIAIAVATPVNSDHIKLTNSHWSFSIRELKSQLKISSLDVINDFTAQALSVPHLTPQQVIKTGGGEALINSNIAVIGPGTGLGVSGLIYSDHTWYPVSGEGGHVSFYPCSERGQQVMRHLRKKYDHVSAERMISGQGLVNIFNSLCEIDGTPDKANLKPKEITQNAINQDCQICVETIDLFFDMLGTVAGNLALTLGAQHGVYITGGIVPKIQQQFLDSKFRESFEAHGRFRSYLEAIPSYLITYPYVALTGLAAYISHKYQ